MNNLKLCVLGRDDTYTAMVVKCLRSRNLNFTLVLEGGGRIRSRTEYLLELPLALYRALTSGRYKPLPMLSWFKLRTFVRERIFYRSQGARILLDPLKDVAMEGIVVPSINHVRTLKLIEREKFDIGLFAGVGIVDGAIIDAFHLVCLNAHPAPLPQCRGGGALINTLNQGLHPAVSVHVATAEVDKGEILRVMPLQLRKDDCYDSITLRLSLLCADTLAEVALEMSSDKSLKGVPNNGTLHYWKDCTLDRQRAAIRRLQQLLEEV
jgi:hypothetical protein